MKKHNLQQYKDDFNDKYTTSVTADDILKDINLSETIDERKGFRDFYQRNVKRIVKRLVLLFSCILVLMISLTVVIMNGKDDAKDINYDISDILTSDEKELFIASGNYETQNINLISYNSNFKFFFMRSNFQIDNNFSYRYFYKVFFELNDDEVVLKIDDEEFIINQDNPFGQFYMISKQENEILTLSFSLIYEGQTKKYSFEF